MRKFGNFVFGALVGGLVGGILGALLAPASGEKTRQEISDYLRNIQTEVKRAADEKRAELEAQLQKLRSGGDVTIE